ncbi:MAG: hypothetical protein ACO3NE_11215 [Alphaproteobacteria bacterium]
MKRLITFLVVSFCVSMGTATTATANPKALKEEHVRLSETSIAYDEQIARNIAVVAAQNQKYESLCSANNFTSVSCAKFKEQLDSYHLQVASQKVQADLLKQEIVAIEAKLAEAIEVNTATINLLAKRLELTALKIEKVRRRQVTVERFIENNSSSSDSDAIAQRARLVQQLPTINQQLFTLETDLDKLLAALQLAESQKATD